MLLRPILAIALEQTSASSLRQASMRVAAVFVSLSFFRRDPRVEGASPAAACAYAHDGRA